MVKQTTWLNGASALTRRAALVRAGVLPAAMLGMGRTSAQEWGVKTVRIVVPSAPGSGPDALAREIAEQAGAASGRTFIVENRPGANGIVGSDLVARAGGDGATLLLVDPLALVANPYVYKSVPFNWRRDLRPVAALADVDLFLFSSGKRPFASVQDVVAYAKANPGKLNFGTTGNASVEHLSLERLKAHTGIVVERIPYGGGMGQLIPALISGEIDLFVFGPLPFIGHVKEGTVRSLAVASAKRSAVFPAVPTLAEAGFPNDLFMGTTFTLFAPGRTPDKLVGEISALVAGVVNSDKFRDKFAARGLVTRYEAPEPVMRKLDDIDGRVAPMIKAMSLSLV
jgi:tripartite-type tricarboxylate transporter receptor subunit TctC